MYNFVVQDIHDGLDFSQYGESSYPFGIFCIKFSTDGRELVAGTSDDAIYVYDLEANKLSLRISAHTVCTPLFSFFPLTVAVYNFPLC